MSDNDLVMRGDVKATKVYCDARHEYVVPVAEIDWLIPAVPHEMSAREYLHAFQRMCKCIRCCPKCPLYGLVCGKFDSTISEIGEAIAIVESWAIEHPEER